MSLRLGVVVDCAGAWKRTGDDCVAAVKYAIGRTNAPVDLEIREATTPGEAGRATSDLARRGAQVVLGSPGSEAAAEAMQVASDRRVCYWEMAAASDELAGHGGPFCFRLSTPGSRYGAAVAEYLGQIVASRTTKVSVVYGPSAFSTSLVNGLTAAAGLSQVGSVAAMEARDRSDEELERAILADGPDVLVLVKLGARTATLWSRIAPHRVVRAMFANASWGNDTNVAAAGAWVDGTYTVSMTAPGSFPLDALGAGARADLSAWMHECGDRGERHAREAAVDRDHFFAGTLLLLRDVAPRATDLSAAALAAAARLVDLAPQDSPVAMGVRFDDHGRNVRSYAAIRQWRQGRHPTVYPPSLVRPSAASASKASGASPL